MLPRGSCRLSPCPTASPPKTSRAIRLCWPASTRIRWFIMLKPQAGSWPLCARKLASVCRRKSSTCQPYCFWPEAIASWPTRRPPPIRHFLGAGDAQERHVGLALRAAHRDDLGLEHVSTLDELLGILDALVGE